MKLKKWLITGVLCAAIVLGGVACAPSDEPGPGPGPGPDPDPSRQVTLRIESAAPLRYDYTTLLNSQPEDSQLYKQALFTKQLVDGFKQEHPNIRLQFIENGWGEALYQTQQTYIRNYLNGGTLPVDIMIGETYMNYFASNGLFVALDKEKFSDIIEGAYADVMVDGSLYGVPMCTGIMGLQYNTDILDEVGIPEEEQVPETWDELLENCRKVSEYAEQNKKQYGGIVMNNVKGMSSAFRALPFLRQAGGDIMKDGKLAINSAESVTAFEYLRSLAQYAYGPSLTEEQEDLLQIYFRDRNCGAYMIELAVPMAIAPENTRSAPLPTKNADGTGVGNVFCGNVLFGVAKGSKNQQEAELFLEYLTSAEVQKLFYELDGRLPVSKQALESEELRTVHPNINSYLDQLLAGGFSGGLASFTKNSSDIWSNWGSFYSNVLRSKTSVQELADSVQSTISGLM